MTLKQRFGRWLFAHLPITRYLFDQLRFEANAWLMRLGNSILPLRRRRLAALRRGGDLRVNVACGPQVLPGFTNLDLFPCRAEVIGWDCRRALPLADGSAAAIRVEQFVEHLEPRRSCRHSKGLPPRAGRRRRAARDRAGRGALSARVLP